MIQPKPDKHRHGLKDQIPYQSLADKPAGVNGMYTIRSLYEVLLMHMRISAIVLLTIVLVGLALLVGSKEAISEELMEETLQRRDFVVQVGSGENVEDIRIWESVEGGCYVFLPGYAQMEETFIVPGESSAVIDGVSVSETTSCKKFNMNETYPFTYVRDGITIDATMTFVQSGNIPSIYVDTYSGSMDYIHEQKGNEEPGLIRVYTNEGKLDYKGGLDFIKGRGNSTWDEPKKPYSIKLSSSADLLGMGSAEKWILLADAYDESNLRNKIGFELAEKAGMEYTPDSQWINLYLNGEYAGLYLLTERNEVHDQRVDISYSDSFLVSIERGDRLAEQGYPYISTEAGNYLRIHYSSLDAADLTAIWQSVENALLAEDGVDPISGKNWEELIDVDSWAMRLLVDEIMANFDGGSCSQFFYYDASSGSGKVKAGPVWDLDNTLTEGEGSFKEPNVIAAHREHIMWDTELPLFSLLYQKTAFHERLTELYKEIFLPLAEKLVDTEIEQYADYVSKPANMNRIRWNTTDPGTEAENIRTYLKQRISFLNEYWLGSTDYHLVYLVQYEWPWDCLALRPGETIPDIVEDITGWHILGTGEPFDLSQPIFENVTLVQGDIDFREAKEMYDDIIEKEEVDDSEEFSLPIQRVAPLLTFLAFLIAVFLIDIMRSDVRRRRENRKSDTAQIK